MENFQGDKELNTHTQLFIEARDLNFGLHFQKEAPKGLDNKKVLKC